MKMKRHIASLLLLGWVLAVSAENFDDPFAGSVDPFVPTKGKTSTDPTESRFPDNPGPVSFTTYQPIGRWQTVSNQHFSIRLPAAWTVSLETPKTNSWTYMVRDNPTQVVFSVWAERGGPQFLACECAPEKKYHHSSTNGFTFWSIRLPRINGEIFARTFKVASDEYRLDIHCRYEQKDKTMMDFIIESARPSTRRGTEQTPGAYPSKAADALTEKAQE